LFSRPLRLLVGLVALAGIAIPSAALTQLGGTAGAASSGSTLSNSSNFDEIQYLQQTGSKGAYYAFVPSSGDKTHATVIQSMTGGGGCSTGPNLVNVASPLLDITATPPPNVGAFNLRTGVCAGGGNYSALAPGQGLTFSLGPDTAAFGTGRAFAQAQILLQSQVKNADTDTVQATLFLANQQVGQVITQTLAPCSVSSCPIVTLDTGTPGAFDTLALSFTSGNSTDQVSVVSTQSSGGVPTASSIFYLANSLCAGQTLNTTGGQVSGSVSMSNDPDSDGDNDTASGDTDGDGPICKQVSNFSASSTNTVTMPDGEVSNLSVTFLAGTLAGGAHFKYVASYGPVPFCRPDSGSSFDSSTTPPPPTCPPTWLALGDDNDSDAPGSDTDDYVVAQYCLAGHATASQPFCLVNRSYDYITNPGSTDITDTFDGINDVITHQ
jgi:hypothetical protein